MVAARIDAGLAAHAVEDAVVGGQRCRCGWPRPAAPPWVAPPFTSTTGMRSAHGPQLVEEPAAVGDALDVGQGRRRCRGRRRRSSRKSVTPTMADVAGRDGPADADAAGAGVVHERRHEVAGLAGHADAPGRRVGRHDLGAQRRRGRDDALAVGPDDQDARARRPAPPARPGPGAPRRPPRRSRPRRGRRPGCPWPPPSRSRSGLVDAGVHTNTRSASPSGTSSSDGTVSMPSTGVRLAVGGEDLALRSRRPGCCGGRRSRTCPGWVEAPATTTPRGSNRARNCSARSARSRHAPRPGRRRRRHAVDHDERVEVGRHEVGRRPRRRADRPTSTSTSRSRSTAGSPRNGAEQRLGGAGRRSCRAASTRSIGTRRMATSATASARMPPTPTITVMPNCGSSASPAISSRLPRTIGATSTATSPSSGVAAASSSVAAAAHRRRRQPRPRRTSPRSVLWAMWSPHSLATTG